MPQMTPSVLNWRISLGEVGKHVDALREWMRLLKTDPNNKGYQTSLAWDVFGRLKEFGNPDFAEPDKKDRTAI